MKNFTFLHNPERNTKAIEYLLQDAYNHPSIIKTPQMELQVLLKKTKMLYAQAFDYSVGSFIELLLAAQKQGKLAYSTALHPHLNEAARYISAIPLPPLSFPLDSLQKVDILIIPYIDDEIFTYNTIIQNMTKDIQNKYIILDISFALRANIITLDSLPDYADALLIDGEVFGLLKGCGVLLQSQNMFIKNDSRTIMGLGNAFIEALSSCSPTQENQTKILYEYLSQEIPNIELFAPIEKLLPNTLPIRLRGIKARRLTMALFHDNIIIANGRKCLFGLGEPSYVLESMGFLEHERRELVSLSFTPQDINELQKSAQIISLRYKQIQFLER